MFICASTWRKGSCGVSEALAEISSVGPFFDSVCVGWRYPQLPIHCFLRWSGLLHRAPISRTVHGNAHVTLCVCSGVVLRCECFAWRLWAAVTSHPVWGGGVGWVVYGEGEVNWFASCSPLFDPTACSAVSLFGNLWHADDETVLTGAYAMAGVYRVWM